MSYNTKDRKYILCDICKIAEIYDGSESWMAGACAICRDKIIPKYIPLEQHKKYIKKWQNNLEQHKKYIKENYDRKEKYTKRNS